MKTALHDLHLAAEAKMVEFAGWRMPLHYGSQVQEHHSVRRHAGVFDVSHMLQVDISGRESLKFLSKLLAGNVAKLSKPGKAMYTLMLNDDGGVIDDLIVYRTRDDEYRAIFNAAMANTALEWIDEQLRELNLEVTVSPRRDLGILAVQGPDAVSIVSATLEESDLKDLSSFECMSIRDSIVGRTGYTGEDGVEILCSTEFISDLWEKLLHAKVQPCGLGARDTLRLEAGLNLNGSDMDQTITPMECALNWVVDWEPENREFIGRRTLTAKRDAGIENKLTGIVLEDGIMRSGCGVHTSEGDGVVTSGSYSPTLEYSVGLARVPKNAKGKCHIEIRNKLKEGRLVRPPFVRKGMKVHK